MKIVYQWVPGAYSSIAAEYFANHSDQKIITQWCDEFADVRSMIDDTTRAALPIENSYAGTIHDNMYLQNEYKYTIQGMFHLPIDHALITLDETTPITTVYSHRQALAQTRQYCKKHNITQKVYSDTAKSVAHIIQLQDPSCAAIASEKAAQIYQLPIRKKAIQDQKDNVTRFILVGKNPLPWSTLPVLEHNTIIFYIKDRQGALVDCLQCFSQRNINITKIESLASKKTPFTYMFWIETQGDIKSTDHQQALTQLEEFVSHYYIAWNI